MERADSRNPWTWRWMRLLDEQRQRGRRTGSGPDGQLTLKEWREAKAEEDRIYRDSKPLELAPPDAFRHNTTLQVHEVRARAARGEEIGPRSGIVTIRLLRSTAGWKTKPTSEEFYEAVRAEEPSPRQRSLIRMWAKEATDFELVRAEHEHVYTPRMLAEAMHKAGMTYGASACRMNEWAR